MLGFLGRTWTRCLQTEQIRQGDKAALACLRKLFIYLYSGIGLPIFAFFFFVNYHYGFFLLAYLLAALFLGGVLNLIYFARRNLLEAAANLILAEVLVVYLALAVEGGIENTGLFWLHTFPPLALFLTGRRAGLRWISALIAGLVVIDLLSVGGYLVLPYGRDTQWILLFSIGLMSMLVFFYEVLKSQHELMIRRRSQELARLNDTLEARIKEETAKNREKDRLLHAQSRFAAMGEMIGNIAHQWRQPLGTLANLIQDLQDAKRYNEMSDQYLGNMISESMEQIHKMSKTIDNFRNFFHWEPEARLFDVKEAIHRSLKLMEASLQTANVTVRLEGEVTRKVYGYEGEFCQVLLNLLSNAKEILELRQIPRPRITLRLKQQADSMRVEVEDNGGGIKAEVLERVFDPYFSTKHRAVGTGIGLYMARQIVQHTLGGTLHAYNSDSGACFILSLPLHGEGGSDGL